MRSRDEIEEYVAESNAENNGSDTIALLQLEVLLDIRDLLSQRTSSCPDCCYVTHDNQPAAGRLRQEQPKP